MAKAQVIFQIEREPREVCRWVKSVQVGADSDKDALGFLPAQAYEQAAAQGTLFVGVDRRSIQPRYAGHILFDIQTIRSEHSAIDDAGTIYTFLAHIIKPCGVDSQMESVWVAVQCVPSANEVRVPVG